MRRAIGILMALLVLTSCSHSSKEGSSGPNFDGQVVGNAGDGLDALFERGRDHARHVVRRLVRKEYGALVTPELPVGLRFEDLMASSADLVRDVMNSPHVWIDALPSFCADRSACACTPPYRPGRSLSPAIYFARSQCSRVTTPAAAGELLLHESLHHQPFVAAQEMAARGIASALYRIFFRGLSDEPHWRAFAPSNYVPSKSSWAPYEDPGVHWTGDRLLVWMPGSSSFGYFYDPITDTWEEKFLTKDWDPWNHEGGWSLLKQTLLTGWAAGRGVVAVPSLKQLPGAAVIVDAAGSVKRPMKVAGRPDELLRWRKTLSLKDRIVFWGPWESSPTRDEIPGALYAPARDEWEPIPSNEKTFSRWGELVDATEDSLAYWGGCDQEGKPVESGGIYRFGEKRWARIPPSPNHMALCRSAGVWTGRYLIVWGGWDERRTYRDEGAIFDSVTGKWNEMAYAGIQFSLYKPYDDKTDDTQAVWTGAQMLLISGRRLFAYDPFLNRWSFPRDIEMPELSQPRKMVWTGTELIVWDLARSRGAIFIP